MDNDEKADDDDDDELKLQHLTNKCSAFYRAYFERTHLHVIGSLPACV